MVSYGYTTVTFSEEDVKKLGKIVRSICHKDDFYYSDIIDYIKGDVTSDLHLTLLYGIKSDRVNKEEINGFIKGIRLDSVKLGEVTIAEGYKHLYKMVRVKIIDADHKLGSIRDSFKKFEYEESVQYDTFEPHLTLAYVKPSFELRLAPAVPKELRVKGITYFED